MAPPRSPLPFRPFPALLLLLALGAPAQVAVHALRREAGLVHEALARIRSAAAGGALTDEERTLALDALETALRDGEDWLVPVPVEGAPAGLVFRLPAWRLAARLAVTLPPGLAAEWRRRSDARAGELAGTPGVVRRRFPGSAAAGELRLRDAREALERGLGGRATRALLEWLEAFSPRLEDAPAPPSEVATLLAAAAVLEGDDALAARARALAAEHPEPVALAGARIPAPAAVERLLAGLGGASAPAPDLALELAWETTLRAGAGEVLRAAVDRDRVAALVGGELVALDVTTGARAWSVRLTDAARETTRRHLAPGGGRFLVAAAHGAGCDLTAYRTGDGGTAWTFAGWEAPLLRIGLPVVREGLCLVPVETGVDPARTGPEGLWIAALEAETGRLRWRTLVRATTEEVRAGDPLPRAAIHGGLAFLGLGRGELVALRLEDGAPWWALSVPGDPEATEPAAGPALAARSGGLVVHESSINLILTMACDIPPDAAAPPDPGVRLRPAGPANRLLSPRDGPDLLGRLDPSGRFPLAVPLDARDPAALARSEAALPAPLCGAARAAVSMAGPGPGHGVFVTTGRYIYGIDPLTGEPGGPLLGRESGEPGAWLDLLSAPGGAIAVTPVSLGLLRRAR